MSVTNEDSELFIDTAPPDPPFVPPGYVMLEPIGEGGIGRVLLGFRTGDTRLRIIKVLRPELLGRSAVTDRFLREAQIHALLDHPNIAQILDAGHHGGKFYLSCEHIPGLDLETLHRVHYERTGELLPLDLSLNIALRALEALSYVHNYKDPEGLALQLIHRDITPRNVMVSFDGQVKLIDFGIAHVEGDTPLTNPGAVIGTPQFMSPEQAQGLAVDHRSDIYSLAGVLYFLLTGRRPVPDGPLVDMLMHVVADMPMSSRKLNTAISLKLEGAILHALDKNVDDRFNSASAFSDALKAAVPQLSIWSQVRTSAFISQYKQDLQRDIERWQTIARTASDVEVSQDLHNDDSTNSLKLGDATRSEFRPMTPTPLRAYSSIRPNTPFPTARSPSQLSRSKTIRDLLLLSIGISAGTALSAGITFFLVNDRGVETSAPPPVATIPSVKSPPSSPQIVPLEVPTKAPVRKTSKRRARSSTSKKLHSPSPRKAPILSEEPKAPPPPASPKERLRRIIGKATRLLERPESNSQKDALSMLLANANRTHQSKRIDPQQVDALEKQLRDIQSKVP